MFYRLLLWCRALLVRASLLTGLSLLRRGSLLTRLLRWGNWGLRPCRSRCSFPISHRSTGIVRVICLTNSMSLRGEDDEILALFKGRGFHRDGKRPIVIHRPTLSEPGANSFLTRGIDPDCRWGLRRVLARVIAVELVRIAIELGHRGRCHSNVDTEAGSRESLPTDGDITSLPTYWYHGYRRTSCPCRRSDQHSGKGQDGPEHTGDDFAHGRCGHETSPSVVNTAHLGPPIRLALPNSYAQA